MRRASEGGKLLRDENGDHIWQPVRNQHGHHYHVRCYMFGRMVYLRDQSGAREAFTREEADEVAEWWLSEFQRSAGRLSITDTIEVKEADSVTV